MKKELVFIFIFFKIILNGQEKSDLQFAPRFGKQTLLTDSIYYTSQTGKVHFESFRFYLSNFRFVHNGKIVFREENSFHLLDINDPNSLLVSIAAHLPSNIDELVFDLGIDSLTNVSGAMGGVLDPSKGMYWTWQSGYINLKLEGTCDKCSSRKNEFQLHLGGYEQGFNSLQTISVPVNDIKKIRIEIDLEKFIQSAGLSQRDHIMSPNEEAVKLSRLIKTCFMITKG